MTSLAKIELNVCRAYIARVREKFLEPTYESEKFLLILGIYEWQLKRVSERKPATFNQLMTLKHGVREAEIFLHSLAAADKIHDALASEIQDLLWAVVLELTKAIISNEALYPELSEAFDQERAEYRRMKQQAEEAEAVG